MTKENHEAPASTVGASAIEAAWNAYGGTHGHDEDMEAAIEAAVKEMGLRWEERVFVGPPAFRARRQVSDWQSLPKPTR